MNKTFFLLVLMFINIINPMSVWADNPYSSTGSFSANIIAGTCAATVISVNGSSSNVIDLGDVYLTEVMKKSNNISFSLKFSECLGVGRIVVSNIAGQCSGKTATDSSFGNQLTGAEASAGVGLEIWGNDVNSGNIFDCHTPKDDNIVITLASTPVINSTNYTQNMHARLVESSDASTELKAGDFSTTVSFTVSYE